MPHPDIFAAPMPLFERLEDDEPFSSEEYHIQRLLSADELRASVRAELMRLLNTRRGAARGKRPLGVLEYGLPDWSAHSAARSADRSALERDIVDAIRVFEPRLVEPRALVEPDPDAPFRLWLRIVGGLQAGNRVWPVAFAAALVDGQPLHIVDERLA